MSRFSQCWCGVSSTCARPLRICNIDEIYLNLLGINHTINELQSIKIPGLLLPDHFRANSKIKVDYHLFNKWVHFSKLFYLYLTFITVFAQHFSISVSYALLLFFRENMPSHFKFKEYCPLVFKYLRDRFGLDDVEFRESLTRSQPHPLDVSGKSGAKFYTSYDKLYIIKTITSEEVEKMHTFLWVSPNNTVLMWRKVIHEF